MATENVAPLRDRIATLRRELSDVEDEGQRTLRQILATGVADSDLARGLLADIEARRDALRASVATAEGELAAKETEHLDLELVTQAIQGFDDAFEHLTSAEKREFLQLLVHKATVPPRPRRRRAVRRALPRPGHPQRHRHRLPRPRRPRKRRRARPR